MKLLMLSMRWEKILDFAVSYVIGSSIQEDPVSEEREREPELSGSCAANDSSCFTGSSNELS
jgi:hypothetical protein